MSDVPLKRTIGLPLLTLYGLGTIVGGGFYALIGEVAGEAGMFTPVAFLIAASIGLLSGLSFAELSARFPVSAGESHYVLRAFGRRWLSACVGWMVVFTGVVSAATLCRAFARFTTSLWEWPEVAVSVAFVAVLTAIAVWGISESVWAATLITLIEVGGLVFVIGMGADHLTEVPAKLSVLTPSADVSVWTGIAMGAYLGFYSFVGFEDLVNIAEEVKNPRKTLPWAILLALLITTLLYALVTSIAVLSVPLDRLQQSKSPLGLVVGEGTSGAKALAVIGMLAGVNGALVQIVMASRVAYGMSKQRMAPRIFSAVHPKRQTPTFATLAGGVLVLALAVQFPLALLAKVTSTILLVVYGLVSLSIVVLRLRDPKPTDASSLPQFPLVLHMGGCVACFGFLAIQVIASLN